MLEFASDELFELRCERVFLALCKANNPHIPEQGGEKENGSFYLEICQVLDAISLYESAGKRPSETVQNGFLSKVHTVSYCLVE